MKSFVEVQFPVAQLSVESYIERDAKAAKPLSSLAKWWGAKPIVLARALIVGTVMPASDDPGQWADDLEVFLRIMLLDPEGMWYRKTSSLPAGDCYSHATAEERASLFHSEERWKAPSTDADRLALEKRVFLRWDYGSQRPYCCRVDQIDGLPADSWVRINNHFGFSEPVTSLSELVPKLSMLRFGRLIKVGDAFCGSGILPLAASQLGLPAYASDLNPAAALLTWNAVNLVGGDDEYRERVHSAQERLYQGVQNWLDGNRYERSEEGWQAQAYLYCEEIRVPEWDDWAIPVAPNWIIAPKTKTWVELVPDRANKRFEFKVHYGGAGWEDAANGTKDGDSLLCPPALWGIFRASSSHKNKPRQVSRNAVIDRSGGIRQWSKEDLRPRPDDVLQERLFCIRWWRPKSGADGFEIFYREPQRLDVETESRMAAELESIAQVWMSEGWIPSWHIENGYKTTEPKRTKGWTHWHQLFTPHQLLVHGKYSALIADEEVDLRPALLMSLAKVLDMNNRLCHWLPSQGGGIGGSKRLFYNQAFNPFPNYVGRGWPGLQTQATGEHGRLATDGSTELRVVDARQTDAEIDVWLTDPPYADAVHYEELTEFFLAWYAPHIQKAFPDWPKDSRRIQTIQGSDSSFARGMAESYSRLTTKTADDGFQIIMFTHKSSDVWSDLTLIVWEAGLEILNVWNVATETGGTGTRTGDFVQTTYNLVSRKRTTDRVGFMDQIKRQVKKAAVEVIERMEVERQATGPYTCGYGETDVLLAAQAAAAQVITGYKSISDFAGRSEEEQRQGIRSVLETARQAAADLMLPKALRRVCAEESINAETWWKELSGEERMFFKALEVGATGEGRLSVYQDLARIYGVADYSELMASTEPNASAPMIPELLNPGRLTRYEDIAAADRNKWRYSVTRNVLVAVKTATDAGDAEDGVSHLKLTTDFWAVRAERLVPTLRYLSAVTPSISGWSEAGQYLGAVETAVRNARA
jgi:putative DNA methylase